MFANYLLDYVMERSIEHKHKEKWNEPPDNETDECMEEPTSFATDAALGLFIWEFS